MNPTSSGQSVRPVRRTLGGFSVGGIAVVAVLALALAGCAGKATTPSTSLGDLNATPTAQGTAPSDLTNSGAPTPSPSVPVVPSPTPTVPVTTTPSSPSGLPSGLHIFTPGPIFTFRPPLTLTDCISYNPATVSIVNAGGIGYQITDGSSIMLLLDNPTDAAYALQLVRNYSQQCFIGRSNTRTGNDRYRYIVEYWRGTGVAGATLPTGDCSSYDSAHVSVANIGADGWQVTAGSEALAILDSAADGDSAKGLAQANHKLCFIGRGNSRPQRAEYIVEYWTS